MAATSVTGTGPGSADGFNKGSEHQTLGVDHLIGPRVVAAGVVVLDAIGTATIPVTAVLDEDPPTDFIVLVNDVTDGSATVGTLVQLDNDVYVNILGTPTDTVNWVLFSTGL